MNWYVYIIKCADNSLYTGITIDIERRFNQHVNKQGAKYLRARRPDSVVYVESGHTRSSATKREIEIKKMSRTLKLELIQSNFNNKNPS